jgi:hypothetical protein
VGLVRTQYVILGVTNQRLVLGPERTDLMTCITSGLEKVNLRMGYFSNAIKRNHKEMGCDDID